MQNHWYSLLNGGHSENQASVPHPTRSKRTRESITACIVPLISIIPLGDELQPTSLTLVQLKLTHSRIHNRNTNTHTIVELSNNCKSLHSTTHCFSRTGLISRCICHKKVLHAENLWGVRWRTFFKFLTKKWENLHISVGHNGIVLTKGWKKNQIKMSHKKYENQDLPKRLLNIEKYVTYNISSIPNKTKWCFEEYDSLRRNDNKWYISWQCSCFFLQFTTATQSDVG